MEKNNFHKEIKGKGKGSKKQKELIRTKEKHIGSNHTVLILNIFTKL